jgi:hypothetical protein
MGEAEDVGHVWRLTEDGHGRWRCLHCDQTTVTPVPVLVCPARVPRRPNIAEYEAALCEALELDASRVHSLTIVLAADTRGAVSVTVDLLYSADEWVGAQAAAVAAAGGQP